MNTDTIVQLINKLFIAVDNRDWPGVSSVFNYTVLLDYTSMAGGEPSNLTADQIINSWKTFLPGFDMTHHQLGNYITEVNSDRAKVFCYGTASHYLANDSNNNLWTVVGSYDLELKKVDDVWCITMMKFNLKYVDGNNDLPKLAQERLRKK